MKDLTYGGVRLSMLSELGDNDGVWSATPCAGCGRGVVDSPMFDTSKPIVCEDCANRLLRGPLQYYIPTSAAIDEAPICEWCNKPVSLPGDLRTDCAEAMRQSDEGIGEDF